MKNLDTVCSALVQMRNHDRDSPNFNKAYRTIHDLIYPKVLSIAKQYCDSNLNTKNNYKDIAQDALIIFLEKFPVLDFDLSGKLSNKILLGAIINYHKAIARTEFFNLLRENKKEDTINNEFAFSYLNDSDLVNDDKHSKSYLDMMNEIYLSFDRKLSMLSNEELIFLYEVIPYNQKNKMPIEVRGFLCNKYNLTYESLRQEKKRLLDKIRKL